MDEGHRKVGAGIWKRGNDSGEEKQNTNLNRTTIHLKATLDKEISGSNPDQRKLEHNENFSH